MCDARLQNRDGDGWIWDWFDQFMDVAMVCDVDYLRRCTGAVQKIGKEDKSQ